MWRSMRSYRPSQARLAAEWLQEPHKEHGTRILLKPWCWCNRRRNRRVSSAQPNSCPGQRWGPTKYRCISSADDLAMRALAGFIAGGLLALIFSLLNLFKHEHINNK